MDERIPVEYLVVFHRVKRKTGITTHSWVDVVTQPQLRDLNHWAHGAKPAGELLEYEIDEYLTVVHAVTKL